MQYTNTCLNHNLSRCMGKPTICIGENIGADQLRCNCEADQRLCFRYMDSTIPLLSKSKVSSLYPSSVTVQPALCRIWSKPKLLVFSCTGLFTGHPPGRKWIEQSQFLGLYVLLCSRSLKTSFLLMQLINK